MADGRVSMYTVGQTPVTANKNRLFVLVIDIEIEPGSMQDAVKAANGFIPEWMFHYDVPYVYTRAQARHSKANYVTLNNNQSQGPTRN